MTLTTERILLAKRYIEEPNTGCWLWMCHIRSGYGLIKPPHNTSHVQAHRYVFEKFYNRKIVGELHHICKIKSCVNPEHMQELSKQDHLKLHGNRKLGDHVQEIKLLYSQGWTYSMLATRFNCHYNSISLLVSGKQYKENN